MKEKRKSLILVCMDGVLMAFLLDDATFDIMVGWNGEFDVIPSMRG